MRELSLDQLRTLLAIVDLGSFSGAARALHLSQPTVSLHVAELESRLDTPLLVRGGRRVVATAAGEALAGRARRLLRDADEAVAEVRRHREGLVGRVRLASSAGATVHVLPDLLEALETAHPGIAVQLTVGRSAELMAQLFLGDVDIALVASPQPDYPTLSVSAWRSLPMMAFVPARWKTPVLATPAWLAGRPLILNGPTTHIYRQTMEWFAAAGLRPTPRVEVQVNEVTRRLVGSGYGATILPLEHPDEALDKRIRVLRLRPALTRRLGVAHRPLPLLDEPTRRVLATVMSFRDASR